MMQLDNIFKLSFILLLFALFIVIQVSPVYKIMFLELLNKFDISFANI